jgi:hypothetical protein
MVVGVGIAQFVDVLTGLVTAAVLIPAGNWLYFKFGERRPSPSGPGP